MDEHFWLIKSLIKLHVKDWPVFTVNLPVATGDNFAKPEWQLCPQVFLQLTKKTVAIHMSLLFWWRTRFSYPITEKYRKGLGYGLPKCQSSNKYMASDLFHNSTCSN